MSRRKSLPKTPVNKNERNELRKVHFIYSPAEEDIKRRKGKLLGIGNPLLDLTVNGNDELLKKYKMEPNNAILATEDQLPIYQDLLENYEVQFTAGGSVQNTLRVCQWILKKPNICVFMGSVGVDRYSEILKKTAQDDGVHVIYQYQKNYPTGTCAVVVTTHEGNQRSLCANLAAAEKFTIDHILEPDNYNYVEKAKFFYISGFFLSVSADTVFKLGEIAAKSNKIFITNLSAPFVCEEYKDLVLKMLPYVDIVFGNEAEALAFAKGTLDTTNLKEIARAMASMPKIKQKTERIVIITQGSHPVLYVQGQKLQEVKVREIPQNKIVDTNGAGDAFVGGFLSQLILDKSIEKCIQCGIWAARHIIQHPGCSFDKKVSYSG